MEKDDSPQKPKKVSVSLYWDKGKNCYLVAWVDLDTGQTKQKKVPNGSDPVDELEKTRNSLESDLIKGDYDTNEKRVRKYIEVMAKCKRQKKHGSQIIGNTYAGGCQEFALRESNIGTFSASKGERVVKAIDDMIENGETMEAEGLRKEMNRSLRGAFEKLDDKYKPLKLNRIDNHISKQISDMAIKIDERFNKKGGKEFRGQCIDILKQLSKKIDEWRASE